MSQKISLFGRFIRYVDIICYDFRSFILYNESIFTIFFLVVFTLEQALLLYIIYKISPIHPIAQFFIGLIILFVLFTAALEKIILQVRYRGLKEINSNMDIELKEAMIEKNRIVYEYELLKQKVEEYIKFKLKK